MNSILKRIKEIATQEDISITALEASIGASKGVFSRALANGTDIQSKWIVKLAENYPHYSPEWLLTGSGEIRKTDIIHSPQENHVAAANSVSSDLIHTLKSMISVQDTTIRSQAITIDTLQKRIEELEKSKPLKEL